MASECKCSALSIEVNALLQLQDKESTRPDLQIQDEAMGSAQSLVCSKLSRELPPFEQRGPYYDEYAELGRKVFTDSRDRKQFIRMSSKAHFLDLSFK